ncbi:MAG: tripartite tricarboxylate transporter substrate binding protein [Candidatus Accumulibacter sp.]|jgi:tripartite-type tricarboxylate transporter receptor subunit TctC|nr:tripartite tricarboxylate transporter substrate binding protein [Accumulibacter sp.]
MNHFRKALFAGFCFAIPMLLGAGAAQAQQDYPNRPIKLIVPYPPGGGVDTAARIIAQPLSERLGQPVVIENKAGSSGIIGTTVASREKPDGYTLLLGSSGPHALDKHLFKKLDFDPIKDFTFIALIYNAPTFVVVPANSPFKTVQELVAYAKANPGKLNYGSSGIGSGQNIGAALFMDAAGFRATHVPYKGTGPMETALVAGQLDFSVDMPTCLPFVQGGKMRVLGTAWKERNAALPDIPTLDEMGIPGVHASNYYGLMGPANMPKDIVDRLNKEVNAILQTSEMRDRVIRMGFDAGKGTPEEFKAFAEDDLARYGDLFTKIGVEKID